MTTGRLEAFTDGVLAIIVTIMVLDLRPPAGHDFSDLRPLAPKVLVYLLSFVMVAIYWNNHHHLMSVTERINGGVMWANMGLLFCLSLIPSVTAWMGPHYREVAPVALYGAVQLAAALAYFVLVRTLLAVHGPDSTLARALGDDRKGKLSAAAFACAIALAFVEPWIALAVYLAVAAVWLIPDRRMVRAVEERGRVIEEHRPAEGEA